MKNLQQTLAVCLVLAIVALGLSVTVAGAAEETPAATVATSGAETGGTVLGVGATTAAAIGGVVVVAAGAVVTANAEKGDNDSASHGHGH